MTSPTNWPDPERLGVPMFPEQDGWHWLSNRPNETPFPAEWSHEDYSDADTEWFWDMGEELVSSHEMRGLYYRGPCPFPGAANEAGCVALNNIATLTEQARKNIAVATGARKMAKAVSPILHDIDNQVNAIRNSGLILTPTQIAEMLAGEREKVASKIDGLMLRGRRFDEWNRALQAASTEIRHRWEAP
ncbi:hypothetical protein K2X14_11410 [Acetobacter sp. TBRC 12305]|uniref:Uncharacterized protein n=1 Tax=Acetobacter garciniae TaxID=2817435 RepID=A0A939HP70_9PROT|nr:hypothetical protein [Acetobacter garciniae]MBO1325383.1 hypothetical protein [Acetobacter garciniae]MBX0345445.1 hypothetical protein [Acetobacter garciniae]